VSSRPFPFRRASLARAAASLAVVALAASSCASGPIGFYQRHLGQQWGFHCDFQPSCSEYGRQAVESYGALPGTLMIADRLMRDHDLEPEEYARDERGRPLDPPAANALFGPSEDADEPGAAALAAQRAQDEAETQRAPLYADSDEEEQLRFADDLFGNGEFERARIEYLRLLHHRPQSGRALHCRERIAVALAKARRRGDALAEAARIADPAEQARTRALVLRELGEPADALHAAEAEARSGPLFTGLLALEAGRADVARASFTSLDPALRDDLLARVGDLEALPSKSRWLAGSLSAVLPGAGQLYAGRAADGAVAFFTNAILIGGTVAAARHDEDAAAVAIGFVAFGFYAGNVYGAVNAAAKHDRDERDGFVARTRGWLRQSGAWLSVTPEGDGGALGLYFGL